MPIWRWAGGAVGLAGQSPSPLWRGEGPRDAVRDALAWVGARCGRALALLVWLPVSGCEKSRGEVRARSGRVRLWYGTLFGKVGARRGYAFRWPGACFGAVWRGGRGWSEARPCALVAWRPSWGRGAGEGGVGATRGHARWWPGALFGVVVGGGSMMAFASPLSERAALGARVCGGGERRRCRIRTPRVRSSGGESAGVCRRACMRGRHRRRPHCRGAHYCLRHHHRRAHRARPLGAPLTQLSDRMHT